jgi:antitoxin (DNA-binding transcriptional repressor) of toxin-antitoxin stability system
MKTLTVQEASRNLSEWVHRAVEGEEVAINDGGCTVLLQPVSEAATNQTSGREALRQLQSQARLTSSLAESYLRQVHAERLAHENGSGQ